MKGFCSENDEKNFRSKFFRASERTVAEIIRGCIMVVVAFLRARNWRSDDALSQSTRSEMCVLSLQYDLGLGMDRRGTAKRADLDASGR